MEGYIQVYTGDGKGKTTAALGLTLRAVGAGLKVFFLQWQKGQECAEWKSLKKLAPQVDAARFGPKTFITDKAGPEDLEEARKGLEKARQVLQSGEWDLVVLDEINTAVFFELLSVDEVLQLLEDRPPKVEVVLTGRRAHPRLLARADLVTEMGEVKHYYQQGIMARPGIEY